MLASGITAIAGFAVADRDRHPDAARLRLRHRVRPRGRAARACCWSCRRRWSGPRRASRRSALRRRARAAAGARPRMNDDRRARPAAAGEAGRPLLALRRARLPGADRGRDREHDPHPTTTASSGPSATERGVPLPEFAVPELLGSTEGDANVFQDDCETAENPAPPTTARTPACEVELPRGDPRLRPLRPAAGDLVLVHRGRRLPADPGRWSTRSPALPRPGQLPLGRRPRRPRRGRGGSSRARLDGSRSAGTATAPSPTSTGSAAARPSPSPTRAGS